MASGCYIGQCRTRPFDLKGTLRAICPNFLHSIPDTFIQPPITHWDLMSLLGKNLPNLTVASSDIWSGDTVQFGCNKPVHYSLGLSLDMLSQGSSCACELLGLQGQPQLHLRSLGAWCCTAIHRILPSRLAGLWLN